MSYLVMEADVKQYTLTDAMRILNVSRQTLMKWIEKGKIEASKDDNSTTAPYTIPAIEVERVRKERIAYLQTIIEDSQEKLDRIQTIVVEVE